MAFENFPSAARQQQAYPPQPNWMAFIAGLLFLALVGAIGYIMWFRNEGSYDIQKSTAPVLTNNNELEKLKSELADITNRYNMLKAYDAQRDSSTNINSLEISEKKKQIDSLLGKVNASQGELSQAKKLIISLKNDIEVYKGSIANYQVQVDTLNKNQVALVTEKQAIVQEKDKVQLRLDSAVTLIKQKDDIIDIGTTLNAVNFKIISIEDKKNGKEKETFTARRVDKLRIEFELGENRIAETGVKQLFVCLTGPDGSPIAVEAFGSGKFETRNGEEKFFTEKLDINYIQGSRQIVSFDWKQNSLFEPGNYKIEVYNNGFRIGEGVRHLKK